MSGEIMEAAASRGMDVETGEGAETELTPQLVPTPEFGGQNIVRSGRPRGSNLLRQMLKEHQAALPKSQPVNREGILVKARNERNRRQDLRRAQTLDPDPAGAPGAVEQAPWSDQDAEATARSMLDEATRASASAISTMLGVDRRRVHDIMVAAASLHLDAEAAAFMSLLEHLARAKREGRIRGLLFAHKRSYDETPERFRTMSGSSGELNAATAKVMACEQSFSLAFAVVRAGGACGAEPPAFQGSHCLDASGTCALEAALSTVLEEDLAAPGVQGSNPSAHPPAQFVQLHGRLGTRLRPMDRQTAELAKATVQDIMTLPEAAVALVEEVFPTRVQVVVTDSHKSYVKAEAALARTQPAWTQLHLKCQVHRAHSAHVKSTTSLLPSLESSLVNLTISLQGAMNRVRIAMAERIHQQLVIYHDGEPSAEALAWRASVEALFLADTEAMERPDRVGEEEQDMDPGWPEMLAEDRFKKLNQACAGPIPAYSCCLLLSASTCRHTAASGFHSVIDRLCIVVAPRTQWV
jgi:hypothetical protein